MPDNEIILWQGNTAMFLQNLKPDSQIVSQSRFFIPTDILVSRFGILAMLLIDSKTESRKHSYSDDSWVGVNLTKSERDNETYPDAVQRAHWVETEKGFSMLRVFVLPQSVMEIFQRDSFLGRPMIAKCSCDKTFDEGVEFDEEFASVSYSPVNLVLPFIQEVSLNVWNAVHVPSNVVHEHSQINAWISFHGWFAYTQSVAQAQAALVKGLGNFDTFIGRFGSDLVPLKKEGTQLQLP